jgi:hypothetical protein
LVFTNAFLQQSKHSVARVNERLDAALIAAAKDAEETCGMMVIGRGGRDDVIGRGGRDDGDWEGRTGVGWKGNRRAEPDSPHSVPHEFCTSQ